MPEPSVSMETDSVPASAGAFSRELTGRVLVVDDELPNRLYLRKLLSARGCTVFEAPDGPSALALAREERPDLVLADVMMPGMDGFELCRQLKEDPAIEHIPVILVTAKSRIEDIETGFVLGAMDYIRKPFNPRELVLRVGNALDLKRSTESLNRWKNRVSHELELAGAIQRTIFPEKPYFSRRFEIRCAYQPSMHVGGDAFDIIELPDGGLCVYLGDVSGHGVAPALISALLKATVSELVRRSAHEGPAELCNDLHNRFLESVDTDSYYATFFMAIYDPAVEAWRCMNCGHPNPLLIRDGAACDSTRFSGGGGVPIGFALAGPRPYSKEDEVIVELQEGQYFILYTDGISEARHRQTREECGAEEFTRIAAEVCGRPDLYNKARSLADAVRAAGYRLDADDSTIMCIYTKQQDDILLDEQLEPNKERIAALAATAEEGLLARGWGDFAAVAVRLLIMEHGANIADHGQLPPGRGFWLQVSARSDLCKVVFVDDGREWDLAGAAELAIDETSFSERGRGVAIINSVADFAERCRINNQNVCFYIIKNQELETHE